MRSLSRRQKLTGAVLAVVSAVWTLDMLTGSSGPSLAGAAPAPIVLSGPTGPPPDPADLRAVIGALQRERVTRTALPFDRVTRDLFVPTEHFKAVQTQVAESDPAWEGEAQAESGKESLPFEARHTLQGVLTGRVPLALIDGSLLREGAQIDGYRLVEIHADFVVLRQGAKRPVKLPVMPAAGH
jgi:hypothetical protein